jgi:hypothetical protein
MGGAGWRRKRTSTERKDTGPEVSGMEGNINSRQGNGGESTFQFNVTVFCLVLLFGLLEAGLDNFKKHFFDLFNGELLSQLQHNASVQRSVHGQKACLCDVHILYFEIIEDVGHGLKRDKLSRAHILLILHVGQKSKSILMDVGLTSTL